MSDVFTKAKRSDVMSRIRSRGNRATELVLAKLLRRHNITGWRRHVQVRGRDATLRRPSRKTARTSQRDVPTLAARAATQPRPTPRGGATGTSRPTIRVRPDFVFPRQRLAVFVDGCFWHGCPWHGTKPASNRAFWRRKFANNILRDRLVTRALRRSGWRVVRIWEHALKKNPEACARKMEGLIL